MNQNTDTQSPPKKDTQVVTITGGAGFIGTQLARVLKTMGHRVILIDLYPSKSYPDDSVIADVTDEAAMIDALNGVDVIYHLAAEHRDDVSPISRYQDVNVGGGNAVISAAKTHNIKRIIFASTVAVYPLIPADLVNGSSEAHTPAPFNPYGQSKLDSERSFEAWATEDKARSLTIIRLVATFGVGNRGNIFTLINQIASGKFLLIGDGENRKSIAYVGNVAAFFAHAMKFKAGVNLYNYADKPDLTMKDFVGHVRASLGMAGHGHKLPYVVGLFAGYGFDVLAMLTKRKFPISSIRVKKFCANTIVNADKLEDTGFGRPYSLEKGLAKMINVEFPSNGGGV